jgi:hypothetical protein
VLRGGVKDASPLVVSMRGVRALWPQPNAAGTACVEPKRGQTAAQLPARRVGRSLVSRPLHQRLAGALRGLIKIHVVLVQERLGFLEALSELDPGRG